MQQDLFGLDVSLPDAGAVADWNRAMLGSLAHAAATPMHLNAVLARAPGFALGQAARGLFCLLLGRREMQDAARDALAAARSGLADGGGTQRERLYVAALDHWLARRPRAAAATLEEVLLIWPDDALAMKLGQAIRFLIGDQAGMRASVERLLPRWRADHPALGYLHGCHAFTLEEGGAYGEAEAAGRRALDLAPDDAWGLHAVAHVHDMTARPDEGVAFLAANRGGWAHCNNFRYHVWWHLALMHLDRGETEMALALYDTEVRSDLTDDYRDIANATSLLMRLELEGVVVGGRWEELAALCAARTEDGCLAFADLHYMLALCGGGQDDAARALLRRMHVDALRNMDETDAVMRHPSLSVAHGLVAFRQGHHARAFAALSGALGALLAIGGSHAQRDVFERIAIEAGIRCGALGATRDLLEARVRRRGAVDGFAAGRFAVIEALLAEGGSVLRNRLA